MKEKRAPFLLGFLIIFSIIAFSFYLELIRGIYPCPLCELQRLTFILLGVFFCLGCLLYRFRSMRYFLWIASLITSLIGVILAGKQVWIQYFPEKAAGSCAAGLMQLFKMFPIHEVIQQIFNGSAECTEKGWMFLSLGLAEWAFISFAGLFIFAIYQLRREYREKI